MVSRKSKRRQKIMNQIDKILWEVWDPIGVNDSEIAKDEYSSYVPGVYRLLKENADDFKIEKHLMHIEKVDIGLSVCGRSIKNTIKELRKIEI